MIEANILSKNRLPDYVFTRPFSRLDFIDFSEVFSYQMKSFLRIFIAMLRDNDEIEFTISEVNGDGIEKSRTFSAEYSVVDEATKYVLNWRSIEQPDTPYFLFYANTILFASKLNKVIAYADREFEIVIIASHHKSFYEYAKDLQIDKFKFYLSDYIDYMKIIFKPEYSEKNKLIFLQNYSNQTKI